MHSSHSVIELGNFEVRLHERTATAHGREIPLTSGEFDIVLALAEHPGWVFSAEQLASDPGQHDHSPESVSVLVSRLRQKLAAAGVTSAIETVRGCGYRLAVRPTEQPGVDHDDSASRELRDAAWKLGEVVVEVEHTATSEQQLAARDALEQARHHIFGILAR